MKILLIEWSSCGREDLKEAFIQEGHSLIYPPFSIEGKAYQDLPEIERQFLSVLHEENPDIVFTVNYFPAVSILCNRAKIRYISWIYDSPYRRIFSQTIINPCNSIYVFDRYLYMQCRDAGISTVHYMPMAVNIERLDLITANEKPGAYDVSFVGSLYLENSLAFMEMSDALPEYARGYLDALVAAQMKIQGYNFIEEVLGPVIEDLCRVHPVTCEPGSLESREYYYAEYIIGDWITAARRIDMLKTIAGKHRVDLFTEAEDFSAPNLCNHGIIDYYDKMPRVFKQSKINLNISRYGIKSGIPLRAIDIMGCGGFLLSNYQADFLEHFVPGEDFVFYESKEDLLQKVDYYLRHEKERMAIAKNGHDKVAAGHTYRHRIREMLYNLRKI